MSKKNKTRQHRENADNNIAIANSLMSNSFSFFQADRFIDLGIAHLKKIPEKYRTDQDYRKMARYLQLAGDNKCADASLTEKLEGIEKYYDEALKMLRKITSPTLNDKNNIAYLQRYVDTYRLAVTSELRKK